MPQRWPGNGKRKTGNDDQESELFAPTSFPLRLVLRFPFPVLRPRCSVRTAVVHDWLNGMRGGEKVLEAILPLLPDPTIFTLFHVPGSVSREIEKYPIRASFLNRLPFSRKHYRHYLPLFPSAVESFDLSGFD